MQSVDTVEPANLPVTFDAPIPLRPRYIARPFPTDALPEPFRTMVEAVAEATQTDPAMAGVTALSVLAAAAGGCAEVQVRPGWREPLCLFTAVIAAPGERKSAVQAMLTEPVVTAEEELAAKSEVQQLEARTLKDIAVKFADKARTSASHAEGDKKKEAEADAIGAALQAEAIKVPPVTRLIADDVTPEAAGSLMAEQQRLAIISAEGGVLDTIAGRYSNGIPNMDLFLKGHAGDRLRIDRKGRAPEYVKRPCLTVGLMVQPAVIDAIGRNQQFRGRGLLARFLYAEPRSMVGTRNAQAAPVPEDVTVAYATALKALVHSLSGWVGDPVAIQLTERAHRGIVELLEVTERELGDSGALASLRDWGSKYAGAVVRIAGLLHLAAHGEAGTRRPIDIETILSAARIGTYFKLHAIRAFTTMATDANTANAIYVLQRVVRRGEDLLTQRDIYNETRARFKTVPDLLPVIAHLVDHGFLQQLPEPENPGPGRRPSPRFAVHPQAADYAADYAQAAQTDDSAQSAQSARSTREAAS
ncbi:MAG: YfjI family protein [Aeromicrobium sp.]